MNSEIIVIPALMAGFVIMIKIISDNRVRRMLVEKGHVDENVRYLYQRQAINPLNSVKWGLVLIGIGLAVLLAQFFPYTVSDEIMIGCMFLFAGFGFLIFYRMNENKRKEMPGAVEQDLSMGE